MEPNRSDYPSNSHRERDESGEDRPKFKKVVDGKAVERKKPLSRRIAETFTGDDARTVGDYILFDIVIPAAKSMMSDAVSQGVERMLFGTSSYRSSRGSSSYSYGNRSQGSAYTNRYRPERRPNEDPRDRRREDRRSKNDFLGGEIILETRTDAEVLLDNMREAVGLYQSVSVADVDDFLGITDDDWMRRQWGWVDLDSASIRRLRTDEYLVDLPNPVKLV